MKVKFQRSYKKVAKSGTGATTVFVYTVSGSEDQIAQFKKAQGENYRESESGEPIYFSTRFIGNNGNLIVTASGKIAADMSAFDQAASLASQYGGNLGEALAKAAAATLLGNPSPATVTAGAGVADLSK